MAGEEGGGVTPGPPGARWRRSRSREISNRRWALFVAAALVTILAYSAAHETADRRTPQLSAWSGDWNDLSDLRADLEDQGYSTASILSSPTLLDRVEDPSSTCLFVAGLERPYTTSEAFALYDFFLRGGKLVVADDFGFMDSLSNYADESRPFMVEPTGGRLWDQSYQRNPAFVRVSINEKDFFSGNVLMNEPSAFTSQGDGEVLARSTSASWVDLDNDRRHDPEELYDNHVVMRLLRSDLYVGGGEDGRAVFISDPSMFINDMYGRLDNRNFTLALMRLLLPPGGNGSQGGGYTVIFDESRHASGDAADSAETAFFDGLVRSTTDNNFRILTAVVAMLAALVLIVASENPRTLVHRQELGLAKFHHLRTPHLTRGDAKRMRSLFRERVRLAYGMDRKEFDALDDEGVRDLIDDDSLADFVLTDGPPPSGEEMESMLNLMLRWE